MTTTQQRKKFKRTFTKVSIMILQRSTGERIKYNFMHQDPVPPLKLAGLYYTKNGHRGLGTVFHGYIQITQKYDLPMILRPYSKLTTPSIGKGIYWEGRDASADSLNHCHPIVDGRPTVRDQVFIGTTMGFTGDPYNPFSGLDEEEAYLCYTDHVKELETSTIDHVRNGLTPSLPDAIGYTRALSEASIPYSITFLIRKGGKLMDEIWLNEAIDCIDAKTGSHPLTFYQVNCIHPRNVMSALDRRRNRTSAVRGRLLGLEGNGPPLGPEKLDSSPVVYSNPADEWMGEMMKLHKDYGLKLLDSYCGTNHDRMEQLAIRVRQVYDEQTAERKAEQKAEPTAGMTE